VKIYTSRVDSVDTETKNLLNGLFESSSGGKCFALETPCLTFKPFFMKIATESNQDDQEGKEGKRKVRTYNFMLNTNIATHSFIPRPTDQQTR
jgi:hypothetical protein